MRTNAKMKTILALGVAPTLILPTAYANGGLTPLIGALYSDMNVVSRELVGFVPSVTRNTSAERAGLGQSVSYPIAGAKTATDITPAMQVPEPVDQTYTNQSIIITKSRSVRFGFTGEEQKSLANGVGAGELINQDFAEAIRTLTNEIEQDMATEVISNASRATGTAGTTPYAAGVGDSAQIAKILKDNGAPLASACQVLDTTAGAQFQSNTQLTRVNESGDRMTLRDGEFGRLHKMSIKESGADMTVTSSGSASINTDGSAYPVGTTAITMASGGHVAGDVVSIAGDQNKYVVASSVGTALTLAKPGLRVAIPAVATAVTTAASYTGNVGFAQSAAHLVTRAPALPSFGGREMDKAVDNLMLQDPRSGLVFEIRLYEGYRKMAAEIGIAWGVHASQPEHIALLLG